MGTPGGMAAMGMGNGKSSMSIPTSSSSVSGSWSSTSAAASASSSPVYTGAAQKMSGSIAGVVGAGLVAAAALV